MRNFSKIWAYLKDKLGLHPFASAGIALVISVALAAVSPELDLCGNLKDSSTQWVWCSDTP